jgi:hypothetical protein
MHPKMPNRQGRRHIQVFGDAWADTTTPHGWSILTVLGDAEFERELMGGI